MICVTGSGGTLGAEVLTQLQLAKAPFRAAYFSRQKAEQARARGIDAVMCDFAQPETLPAALGGCDRLFLLGPNTLDQVLLESNVVDAAKRAGIRHVVKQSVVGAAGDDYSLAHVHRPVEKRIEASGLGWTFLRPNSFMQNVMTFMAPSIRAENTFYSASGTAKISHVDVRDVAAVAVKALTETGHEGKAYTLCGPEALSYDHIAAELSRALGRTVRHVSLAPADLRGALLAEGLSEGLAERMLDLERYFRDGHASFTSHDVQHVTQREARRFSQYALECTPLLQPA
jgi:uncharacterized protein YbjT (DUF2867 family)